MHSFQGFRNVHKVTNFGENLVYNSFFSKSVTATFPLITQNIGEFFKKLEVNEHRDALRFQQEPSGNKSWSYKLLQLNVYGFANGMLQQNQSLAVGDGLTTFIKQNNDNIVAGLGAGVCGWVFNSEHPTENFDRFKKVIGCTKSNAVIIEAKRRKQLYKILPLIEWETGGTVVDLVPNNHGHIRNILHTSYENWNGMGTYCDTVCYQDPEKKSQNVIWKTYDSKSPWLRYYIDDNGTLPTAESTYKDKLIPIDHSQYSLLNSGNFLGDLLDLTWESRLVITPYSPIIYPLLLGAFGHQSCATISSPNFDVDVVTETVVLTNATTLAVSIQELKEILEHSRFKAGDWTSLKNVVVTCTEKDDTNQIQELAQKAMTDLSISKIVIVPMLSNVPGQIAGFVWDQNLKAQFLPEIQGKFEGDVLHTKGFHVHLTNNGEYLETPFSPKDLK